MTSATGPRGRASRALLAVGLAAAMVWAAGCPTDSPKPAPLPLGPPEDPGLPPPRVDLPPIPDLTAPPGVEQHPDGTLTVLGARRRLPAMKGQSVMVTAEVAEVYVCPNPETEDPPCQADHFWLTDAAGGSAAGEGRILVVGYDKEVRGVTEPARGDRVVVEATLDTQEASGFIASDGLLIVEKWTRAE